MERNPRKEKFYNSTAWRRLREAYAKSKGYICERCGNKNANKDYKPYYKQFHVHHIIELDENNIDNPEIALNESNLMLLCQHCHNILTSTKDVLAPGLEFDENGMVVKIGKRSQSNTP